LEFRVNFHEKIDFGDNSATRGKSLLQIKNEQKRKTLVYQGFLTIMYGGDYRDRTDDLLAARGTQVTNIPKRLLYVGLFKVDHCTLNYLTII
jgi:hypothetical protein